MMIKKLCSFVALLWWICLSASMVMAQPFPNPTAPGNNNSINVTSLSSLDPLTDVVCSDDDVDISEMIYLNDFGIYLANLRNNNANAPLFVHENKVAIKDPANYFSYNFSVTWGINKLLVFNNTYFENRSPQWSIPPLTRVRHLTTAEEAHGYLFSSPTRQFFSAFPSVVVPTKDFLKPNFYAIDHPTTPTDTGFHDVQLRTVTLYDYDDNKLTTNGSNRNVVSVTCDNYVVRRCWDGEIRTENAFYEACDPWLDELPGWVWVNADVFPAGTAAWSTCSATCEIIPPTQWDTVVTIDKQQSLFNDPSFTDSVISIPANGEYRYELTYNVVWNGWAVSPVLRDTLPVGVTHRDGTTFVYSNGADSGSCTYTSWTRQVLCTLSSKTPVTSASIRFPVQLSPLPTTSSTFTNVGEILLGGVVQDTDTVIASYVPDGWDEQPELIITKDKIVGNDTNLSAGDTITRWVTITNNGNASAVGVNFSDYIPLWFNLPTLPNDVVVDRSNAGGITQSSVQLVGRTLSFVNGITLQPNQSIRVEITVDVNGLNCAEMDNFVVIVHPTCDGSATTNNCSAIDISSCGDTDVPLTIEKTFSQDRVFPWNTVQFTLTLRNTSTTDAATNVTVRDLRPFGLDYVSHTPSAYSYNVSTAVWTIGTMAPGQTITLVVLAQVDSALTTSSLVNTAEIYEDGILEDIGQDILFIDNVAFSIVKTASPTIVDSDGTVTFTLRYTNNSTLPLTSYTIRDFLPPTLLYIPGSARNSNSVIINPTVSTDSSTLVTTLERNCSITPAMWCPLAVGETKELLFDARVN